MPMAKVADFRQKFQDGTNVLKAGEADFSWPLGKKNRPRRMSARAVIS